MHPRALAAALGLLAGLASFAAMTALPPSAAKLEKPTPMQAAKVAMPGDRLSVADPQPARLVIPSIGVDARIEARGLDAHRNLDTPADFHDVAWYRFGAIPGSPGNAIMNGHVDWWTGDAVFTHLSRLKTGDMVRVIRADGGFVNFKVTTKRTVDANARIASLFAPSSAATLTLITCTGVWNPLTQSDTQRLLVSATVA